MDLDGWIGGLIRHRWIDPLVYREAYATVAIGDVFGILNDKVHGDRAKFGVVATKQ